MKKVLILVIAAVSAIHAYAQNTESSVIIDSLTAKLEKLQHDYNYLSCDYELYKSKVDMTDLSQDINIKASAILMNVYNGRYDQALYNAYADNYDAYLSLFESMKNKFESAKALVILKAATSGFSDDELNVIGLSINSIEKSIALIESGLKYYDVALQAYRGKR